MAQIIPNISPGCQVIITTLNKSVYSGLLHGIEETAGRIVLKNVSVGGVKLYGPQHFYASDIIDLEFPDGACEISSGSKSGKDPNKKLIHKKTYPSHLAKLKDLDTDELVVVSNIFNDEDGDQGIGSAEDEDIFEDFYETESYTLICRLCEKFYEAIVYIMSQEVVGMTFEGVDIGRDGTLSLVQIATETNVIIFDILRLGEEAFKEGLHALLESKDILKVIHDCRWISDLVHSQYGIDMYNVFDTQVANSFVYRSCNGGDWPRYVESLPGCLVSHLDLSQEQVHFMKIRQRHEEKDKTVWLERPLSEKLLSSVHKNVCYLIPLHNVLLSKMLLEFKTGVEIYLNHVNNMGGQIKKCRVNSHLLPYAFTDLPKYMKYNYQTGWKDGPHVEYDSRGLRENCVDISDKRIVFSHDSVWHRGQETVPIATSNETVNKKMSGKQDTKKGIIKRQSLQTNSNENNSNSTKLNTDLTASSSSTVDKSYSQKRNYENASKKPNGHNIGSHQTSDSRSRSKEDENVDTTASGLKDTMQNETVSFSHGHLVKPEYGNSSINSDYVPESDSCVTKSVSASANPHKLNIDSGYRNNTDPLPCSVSSAVSQEKQTPSVKASSPSHSSSATPNNITKSKLWQAVQQALQEQKSKDLSHLPSFQESSTENEHLMESAVKGEVNDNSTCESEEERVRKALQKIENLRFKPGVNTQRAQAAAEKLNSIISSNRKKLSFDTENILTENSLSSTQTSPAFSALFGDSGKRSAPTSSENESSSLLARVPSELDLKRDKDLDSFGIVPAGFEQSRRKKNNGKRWQQEGDLRKKLESDHLVPSLSNPVEEDFALIPMQHSLKRQKELPLDISAIGIGDPFSEDESVLNENAQFFIKSRLALNNEAAIRDEDLDCFHQSEMVKKVLKMASSKPCIDIKKKLLPSKIKSPTPGSL